MNVRAVVGRKRPARPGEGRPRKLSVEQEAQLIAWAANRQTLPEKAAEMGISVSSAKRYISNSKRIV